MSIWDLGKSQLLIRYQCVEYARRFLVITKKAAFIDIPCAYHIWPLDTIEDLTKEEGQL